MSPNATKVATALCLSTLAAIPAYVAFGVGALCENSEDCGSRKVEVVFPGLALLGLAGVVAALILAILGRKAATFVALVVAAVGYAGFAVLFADAVGHSIL